MTPTLVSLYGNDIELSGEDFEDSYGLSGDDVQQLCGANIRTLRLIHRWPKLSNRQRQLAINQHPELMGFAPIIAKIAVGAVKVGSKIVGAISKKVKAKKKAKADAANAAQAKAEAARIEAQRVENERLAKVEEKKAQTKQLLTFAVPALSLLAFTLLKGKR